MFWLGVPHEVCSFPHLCTCFSTTAIRAWVLCRSPATPRWCRSPCISIFFFCRRVASNCQPTSSHATRARCHAVRQRVTFSHWSSTSLQLSRVRIWQRGSMAQEPPHLPGDCISSTRTTSPRTPVKVRFFDTTAGLATSNAVFTSKFAIKAVLYLCNRGCRSVRLSSCHSQCRWNMFVTKECMCSQVTPLWLPRVASSTLLAPSPRVLDPPEQSCTI